MDDPIRARLQEGPEYYIQRLLGSNQGWAARPTAAEVHFPEDGQQEPYDHNAETLDMDHFPEGVSGFILDGSGGLFTDRNPQQEPPGADSQQEPYDRGAEMPDNQQDDSFRLTQPGGLFADRNPQQEAPGADSQQEYYAYDEAMLDNQQGDQGVMLDDVGLMTPGTPRKDRIPEGEKKKVEEKKIVVQRRVPNAVVVALLAIEQLPLSQYITLGAYSRMLLYEAETTEAQLRDPSQNFPTAMLEAKLTVDSKLLWKAVQPFATVLANMYSRGLAPRYGRLITVHDKFAVRLNHALRKYWEFPAGEQVNLYALVVLLQDQAPFDMPSQDHHRTIAQMSNNEIIKMARVTSFPDVFLETFVKRLLVNNNPVFAARLNRVCHAYYNVPYAELTDRLTNLAALLQSQAPFPIPPWDDQSAIDHMSDNEIIKLAWITSFPDVWFKGFVRRVLGRARFAARLNRVLHKYWKLPAGNQAELTDLADLLRDEARFEVPPWDDQSAIDHMSDNEIIKMAWVTRFPHEMLEDFVTRLHVYVHWVKIAATAADK